ncbi:MAG: Flp pilus assembly protein CpaB [Vampirovibrionales bacterium]
MATATRSRKAWVQFAIALGAALVIGAIALFLVYGLVTGLIGQQSTIKANYEKQTQELKQQVSELNKKLAEKAPQIALQEVRAKINIDPGQPITANMLEEVSLPSGQKPSEETLTTIPEVVGKISSVPIVAGSTFQKGLLIDTAHMLPLNKGMRAVSVPIAPSSLIGGAVMVGSRVDVLATFQEAGVTRTLLQNVRVLLLDGDHVAPSDEKSDAKVARRFSSDHITLEVSPKDSERLVLASRIGQVQMTLRPYNDSPSLIKTNGVDSRQIISGYTPTNQAHNAQQLLQQAKKQASQKSAPVTLQVIRGTQSESHAFEMVSTP